MTKVQLITRKTLPDIYLLYIPKQVVEENSIQKGDKFEWHTEEEGSQILLRKCEKDD